MKTKISVSVLIISLFLLSFKLLQNSNTFFNPDFEDIGTIKQSLLKPNIFKKTQKGIWILLDGSPLNTETELYQILQEANDINILAEGNRLPNALGKFIRCSNYLGNGSDPDTLRRVGSTQKDLFKSHKHKTENRVLGHRADFDNSAGSEDLDPGSWAKRMRVETNSVGGVETRPINISLYTYIKIAK